VEDFDLLLDAYQEIGEHIPFLEQYEYLFKQDAMKRVLALMYADIIEFHARAYRYFVGKGERAQRYYCPYSNRVQEQYGAGFFVQCGETSIRGFNTFYRI
jgi:hypothetical protein